MQGGEAPYKSIKGQTLVPVRHCGMVLAATRKHNASNPVVLQVAQPQIKLTDNESNERTLDKSTHHH